MKKPKKKRTVIGRPSNSSNVRVTPIYRKEVDIKKLGRAAIRLAMENTNSEEPSHGEQ